MTLREYLKSIANTIRHHLSMSEDEKINAQDFTSHIDTVAEANWESGYNSGYERGHDEGGEYHYSEGYNSGLNNGLMEGKQAEYDAFWDAFQENGSLNSYYGKFSNSDSETWNDITYNPKYELICTKSNGNGATNVFVYNTSITDTKVPMDCRGTLMKSTFNYCFTKRIALLRVNEMTTYQNAFVDAERLEEINFDADSVIGQNGFDIHWSTKLTHDSIVGIINILSPTAGEKSITLSLTAVNNAFTGGSDGSEWQALIATKPNWTISLV